MQINNLASSQAIAARVSKAIEYTASGKGPLAQEIGWSRAQDARRKQAEIAGGVRKGESNVPEAAQTQDINWGLVNLNLGNANGEVIYTTDVSRVAELALKDANTKLDSAFAAAGISNTPPVEFSLSQFDGSLIVGEHPQKGEISALLEKTPTLAYSVREAFALKSQAIATEKGAIYAEAYQRAYASKGKAAADALTDLFLSLKDQPPRLRYGQSGIETRVGGVSDAEYLASISARLGLSGSVNVSA
jgi:hypothetical protein